ncbi:hypothetical protein [Sphingomonas sp. ERG5]|uniref:hypothetical protein n=1 Tax=Sphingomonas sp. ERG5 TaxID=1381597 RepID=UPI00054C4F86|nr:hypothetical protein [Sphingomonas sp. ERG5]
MILTALALTAASAAITYDCSIEAPKALNRTGENATLSSLTLQGVAATGAKFQVKVTSGEKAAAEVVWPENPMQIAGKFATLPTAKGSVAFSAYSAGPCLFTEQMCMSLVQLVDQPDGTAKIIVTPSALWTDKKADSREPFIVIAEGNCTRAGKSK